MKPEENEQTRICGIVFLDIAQFSQQPGEVQFSWRIELSVLLDGCLEDLEPDHRIVTDTSNGVAIAFLRSPQDAFSFIQRMYNELPKLRNFALRVGAHLGALHVMQGPGGRPGFAGEGVNAAQRVMRFAGINEVLVSRVFQEEVVRSVSGNINLFSPYGKQFSKLGHEHDLFRMGQQPVPSEPLAPLAHDIQDASTTPPIENLPGFGIKAALGALLIMVFGIGLWFAQGNREHSPTAFPAANPAMQHSPVSSVAPKVDDPTLAARPERSGSDLPEKPRLTVAPASGKVAAAKKAPRAGSDRCPNCSCTDLMTKLSLGSSLNETERRYMAERCKK